eukprot:Opistho-2@76967
MSKEEEFEGLEGDGEETFAAGDEAADAKDAADELEDPELEAMKRRVQEMEEEARKLREMQNEVEKQMNMTAGASSDSKEEIDGRSIYVGNVDYASTPEELQNHFAACGTINRVTILTDKFTGHPKGFAYVEFADPEAVSNALALNESLFRGRQIKVTSKRTNQPGFGARGRGRGRGGYAPRGGRGFHGAPGGFYGTGPYRPRFRNRRAFFAPY